MAPEEPPPPGAPSTPRGAQGDGPTSRAATPLAGGDLLTGDAKRASVQRMFDTIAPRYDLVNRIMTGRLDVTWRRKAVRQLGLAPNSVVADLACGTGDFCNDLAAGGLRPVGMDLSAGMLANATTPAPLVQADALCLPVANGALDGVTCGFALRNLTEIPPFLDELARVVRPGGRIALVEVSEPVNPLMRRGHAFYFGRVVPLVGRMFSDAEAYRYLPRSVAYLPPPGELCDMVAAAGFTMVHRSALTGGVAQLITATRRSGDPGPTPSP